MSLENDDDSLVVEANESEKKPRISYTREFLLSFGELETCKGLPSGFDHSILSELEDSSVQERQRPHSNLPLQSFRRNDYSSSPPTRGDYRGYGRWESRSSGWSEKDGDRDSQSEADQDSGRRNYGNQPRRPWQNSEHDGLLGSGSFPRPSGFASGTSAPKGQSNEPYHLNRSNEAYQPPRPYKAVPHVRPNTHDSFNDETFGSTESTSQDRAEEERKRRASFELMRKEQQKVLQEKQKSSANKQQSDEFTDMLLEEAKEEGLSEAGGELNSAVQAVPKDDFGKSSIMSQSSKPRPLVPPGFKSSILEKSSTSKPISSTDKENPKPAIEEFHLLAKGNHTQNGTLDNLGMGDPHLQRISRFPEVHEAVDGEVFELMTNKVPSNPSQESTASILGKFFGSSPTIKDAGSTGFLEKSKQDDPLSPNNAQSSKFALWFNEDDKKPIDDISSSRSNDLLSLIGGGGPQPTNIVSAEPIAPDLPHKGFGITKTPSDSKQLFNSMRQESTPPVAAVLTCEDLEQTILSEYSEKSSTLQPPLPDWNVSGPENVDAQAVDNTATNHLLSLLQKGTGPSIDDTSNTSIGLFGDRPTSEKPKDPNQQASSGQNLSLEALFGSAFMQELQSAQAPVSAQRGSAGSARIDIFEPQDLSAPSVDGIAPNMTTFENNPLSLRQKQPAKSDDPESWLKFDGQRADVDPLEFPRGVPKSGNDIQLPEEESLMIVGDPTNTHNPSEAVFNISEKLAALNSGFRGDQFGRGPYDMMEPERQFNNNPQMHGAQMNHNRRPMLHPLDPMNSQMRFPEHLMQRDNAPLNQQFPPRPFHHPDARVTGFDVPINVNPQMLPPQLRNFPPPQMLRDHPRPQASSFMPEQGFPFNHQQPNIGGLGMPFPVPNAGSGNQHPEAFQRMMEMELRAQSKHTPHSQGMYELDMGFRYR
ncbi:hypothetical protein CTI12_AA265260 [Artemisia annua]|uniref:Uncharacterized protein n=1 Tax=Artemisia annua TaxID=35608 RepID=A0A2U1NHN1_ARTAN|nr:hypothetical protein CTI12_AA265260 [Artemisia annua]